VHRHALSDKQWARLQRVIPPQRSGPHAIRGDRLFINAVLYRAKTGLPWRDLPERFGDFRVVHLRFSRWAKTGVWARVFEHLAQDADNEYAMIDATIVRAHQHSAGAQKKTATTKRSAAAKAD